MAHDVAALRPLQMKQQAAPLWRTMPRSALALLEARPGAGVILPNTASPSSSPQHRRGQRGASATGGAQARAEMPGKEPRAARNTRPAVALHDTARAEDREPEPDELPVDCRARAHPYPCSIFTCEDHRRKPERHKPGIVFAMHKNRPGGLLRDSEDIE